MRIRFRHVDVFADRPLTGNGLIAFLDAGGLSAEAMLALTREMRQFEAIFLVPTSDPRIHEARIFSLAQELEFAGHPVLGAAAALHDAEGDAPERIAWRIRLGGREVRVRTTRRPGGGYVASMDQGAPELGRTLTDAEAGEVLAALELAPADRAGPMQVVSTGLRYLIVPVRAGLDRARIADPGFEALLARLGAQFAYVVDVRAREGRHWENDGSIEDVATGSAAGPVGAYLVRNGLAARGEPIELRQGRFLGRPSTILVTVTERVEVAGPVAMVATGTVDPLPEDA